MSSRSAPNTSQCTLSKHGTLKRPAQQTLRGFLAGAPDKRARDEPPARGDDHEAQHVEKHEVTDNDAEVEVTHVRTREEVDAAGRAYAIDVERADPVDTISNSVAEGRIKQEPTAAAVSITAQSNTNGTAATSSSSMAVIDPSGVGATADWSTTTTATTQLHQRGWCALPAPPRGWAPIDFCERMHAEWGGRVVELLEAGRKCWHDGPGRPGTIAANAASAALKPQGIRVSAVHPSVAQWEPWEVSGPRFYVSIVEAARDPRSGCCDGGEDGSRAPRLPLSTEALLWPEPHDRVAPWLTELGWTLVPPHSDPQCIHADIVSSPDTPDGHPRQGRGRFHHIAWKATRPMTSPASGNVACVGRQRETPAGDGLCTTEIVGGAFTDGEILPEHYAALESAAAPAVVFDSEVLHRGSGVLRSAAWTTTLTAQLCSTSGWAALPHDGRCEPENLALTIPLELL